MKSRRDRISLGLIEIPRIRFSIVFTSAATSRPVTT
jgi:hypothetical protein